MTTPTGVIRHEILQVAEAVAREKNIDQEEVITSSVKALRGITLPWSKRSKALPR